MKPEIFADPVLARLGPIPITQTMATSTLLTLVLIGIGAALGTAVSRGGPAPLRATGRLLFRFLRTLVQDAVGKPWPAAETLAGTLFVFIASSAIAGQLPGVSAPTSNLTTASALAVLVFIAVPLAGIRAKGVMGYLAHYLKPNPLLFPLHVISELSRTLALALRLFGNMMSGHLVVALIVTLAGFFVPVPLMALDLLIGLLQAYIFTILACVYVGAAIRVGEDA